MVFCNVILYAELGRLCAENTEDGEGWGRWWGDFRPRALHCHDRCIGNFVAAVAVSERTRRQNVRRNEYDLYQLICYLLATGISQGKIVQLFNKEKFDSDVATEQEYGLIDITQDQWKVLSIEIIEGLKESDEVVVEN